MFLLSAAAFLGIITVSAQEKQSGGNLFLNMFAAISYNSGTQSSTSPAGKLETPESYREFPALDFKLIGESDGYNSVEVKDSEIQTLYVLAGNEFTIEAQLVQGDQFPANNPTWTIDGYAVNGNPIQSGLVQKSGSTQTKKIYQANPSYKYGTYVITVKSDSYEQPVTRKIEVVVVDLDLTVADPIRPNGTSEYDSILATNIADESESGKPDYANFGKRENETSIIKADLYVDIGNLSKSNCKVKIAYNGVSSVSGTTKRVDGSNLKDMFGRKTKDVYYDYTVFKKGTLRVWTSSPSSSITSSSERKTGRLSASQSSGNYWAPNTQIPLSTLFPETGVSSAFSKHKDLYLEGINPSNNYEEVTATLFYGNTAIGSKSIKLKIIEGKVVLNTNNDSKYDLDENDYKIKDQHDGFQGWYAENLTSTSVKNDDKSSYGFENLFPVKLMNLPKLPAGMKYILQLEHGSEGIIVSHPENMNNPNNILSYLTVERILNNLQTMVDQASSQIIIDNHSANQDVTCLFGVYKPLNNSVTEITGGISLYLCLANANDAKDGVLLDRAKYTFRPIDKYFEMWSTRQNTLSLNYATYSNLSFTNCYPTDDDQYVLDSITDLDSTFKIYDDPTCLDGCKDSYFPDRKPFALDNGKNEVIFSNKNNRDPSKDVFLFLHGFNVTEADAVDTNRVFFRRMYWTGYRGTYIGLTWNGDYNPIEWEAIRDSIDRLFYKIHFDTDVFQAFQTAPAIRNFIKSLPESVQINIAAHSLGNLVMWEALRLLSCEKSNLRINNVVSIEGAVWSDAFRNPAPLYYKGKSEKNKIVYPYRKNPQPPYYNPENKNEEIEVAADLEKHSWSHWFRQPEHSALAVVDNFVNSTAGWDYALQAMKMWNVFCDGKYNHYNRTYNHYRTPEKDSLPEFAALLKQGHRVSSSNDTAVSRALEIIALPLNKAISSFKNEDMNIANEAAELLMVYKNNLTDPIGLTNIVGNPDIEFELNPSELKGKMDNLVDQDATQFGWGEKEHSDMKDVVFYQIYPWYQKTFSKSAKIIPGSQK